MAKMMSFQEYLKWCSDEYKKSKEEYEKSVERAKHVTLPIEFDIYNEGQKNQKFKITKYNFRKTMHDYILSRFGCMILLPLGKDEIKYETYTDKEGTDNFTKMPKVQKYLVQQIYISDKKYTSYDFVEWNHIMNVFLRGLKPYIKYGKIRVRVEEHNDSDIKMILVVDDENFNKDREEKIRQMEDPENLKRWKEEYEAKEEKKRKEWEEYKEQERKEKEEYETWLNTLTPEEKDCRAHGYGPHHPYEENHRFPGYRPSVGAWYTGD